MPGDVPHTALVAGKYLKGEDVTEKVAVAQYHLDDLAGEEVVHHDPAGRTASVYEALASGVLRGEVTPDESL